MDDRFWMSAALREAQDAKERGEVPVGACIVSDDGRQIASAGNRTETDRSATAHAEILAIADACRSLGSRRLSGCTLYVTLEPCPMCAGAIVSARIPRVVFGAKDPRAGAFGSLIDLSSVPLESRPEIVSGVLADECLEPLRAFFSELRNLPGREPSAKEPADRPGNGKTKRK